MLGLKSNLDYDRDQVIDEFSGPLDDQTSPDRGNGGEPRTSVKRGAEECAVHGAANPTVHPHTSPSGRGCSTSVAHALAGGTGRERQGQGAHRRPRARSEHLTKC